MRCCGVKVLSFPTMLDAPVHRGKKTTHKTLWNLSRPCVRRVRGPNKAGRTVQNGSNIFALRFGDHGTKEVLGVGWSKVWQVSNFAQQLPTTRNKLQQDIQTDATCNIQKCWELLAKNNNTSVCTALKSINTWLTSQRIFFALFCPTRRKIFKMFAR